MVKKSGQDEEVIVEPGEGEERIETEVTEEKVTEETVEKEKEEEIGECVCTHCNNRVVPIRVKTAFGGTSYRCPKCGKFFKPQPEGEEVETEKPGGAEEEEEKALAPLEVEMTERIKALLPQYLPRVYGIPRGSKRIQAIIDTITPEQTSNPWNLHAHIKNFAPEADDRHLEAIITKIYSTLENEGFVQAASGQQYQPRYGGRRGHGPRYAPGYSSYPARQWRGGYPEEFEEEEYFERSGRPAKPVKVVVDGQTIETDAEGMMALKRFKLEETESKRLDKEHELRMKKLEAEILNITKGEKGEKEEKVAVTVEGRTINVPASIAPLYLKGENPDVKELKSKLEGQDEKIKAMEDTRHKEEITDLKGSIASLSKKIDEQPTFEEQVESFERVATARGFSRSGKTTLDVISDLGAKADENAKLLLKRMAPGEGEFKPEVKRTPEERRKKAGEIEKKLEKREEVLLAEDELIRAAAKMG